MRPLSLIKLSAVLSALCGLASAYAATDFESSSNFLSSGPGTSFSLDGLSFSGSSYYGVQSGLFVTSNPGRYMVYFAGAPESLSMSYTQPFDLTGFDFGASENVTAAGTLTLTGYLLNGGTVNKTLSFSQASASSFDETALSAFKNLSHVVFGSMSNNHGYAWIDNIAIAPVPEPESALMLLAGLGILARKYRSGTPAA